MHSVDGMQKNFASWHVVTPPPPDDLPLFPVSAHRTAAVSKTEFCQHPFVPCENSSQSLAFVICSADELPSEISAIAVS